MSMKRARRVNAGAKNSQSDSPFTLGVPQTESTWAESMADKPDNAFKPYAMSATFARNDLVLHPKFGKGIVTLVDGNRVEVLFEEGSKKLTHGAG